jgi:hypothetical protein
VIYAGAILVVLARAGLSMMPMRRMHFLWAGIPFASAMYRN